MGGHWCFILPLRFYDKIKCHHERPRCLPAGRPTIVLIKRLGFKLTASWHWLVCPKSPLLVMKINVIGRLGFHVWLICYFFSFSLFILSSNIVIYGLMANIKPTKITKIEIYLISNKAILLHSQRKTVRKKAVPYCMVHAWKNHKDNLQSN